MSFVLVCDRSRLGHKPDYRHGWSTEYVRKSMYACRSVSVACRPAEKRRRRGEIGSIHRSILVGHRRPNRPQVVNEEPKNGSRVQGNGGCANSQIAKLGVLSTWICEKIVLFTRGPRISSHLWLVCTDEMTSTTYFEPWLTMPEW